ncbi:MAG: SDR family oxidoreductase [Rubrivivax sp.]|jgi:NAD(P)-dependent dehydrogenase (short-subunit alcohol dehydrogenase family)|nr:SDR family oxidoreductase [Rubrivivax sp.]
MDYFVTGGTGFIGRFLVGKLLERGGNVHVLVREASSGRFEALRARYAQAADRLHAVAGDLGRPRLGLADADLERLRGRIGGFFHVAAIYDMGASAESQQVANVEGTRHAVQAAQALDAACLHHVSSIAVAGMYDGAFSEDMFAEAGTLEHPYFKTKHDSEAVVRQQCQVPWRIYRPASVVGHSQTGEIDKIDGPYYAFKVLQKLRRLLPPWFPLVGVDSGRFNVVPVDYVVAAMDHLAHLPGQDGECFHLTNPEHHSSGELMNVFADAAHAPRFALRLDPKVLSFVPAGLSATLAKLPPVKRIGATIMRSFGMPPGASALFNWNTRFESRMTRKALKGSGIECPKLETYAHRLWYYWETQLDPDLFVDNSLEGNVRGKLVIITGGGTGIGLATALRLAGAGARIVIAGRTLEKLEGAQKAIQAAGGICHIYLADLADMPACDAFIDQVIADHGQVDILINNAGRSIRRAIEYSYDRFHDFERTMQINYYSPLRLSLRVLPGMSERRRGHVINISSMGVIGPPPRFSAYIASKSALEGWTRCAETEFADRKIHFTNINMPLVRTPMIGPTKAYDYAPTLSPEEAAEMVVDAIIHKQSRVATDMGKFQQVWNLISPKSYAAAMNSTFRMFEDPHEAKDKKPALEAPKEPSSEQVAMASLLKGVHY